MPGTGVPCLQNTAAMRRWEIAAIRRLRQSVRLLRREERLLAMTDGGRTFGVKMAMGMPGIRMPWLHEAGGRRRRE
jgi:hypothetical protein